MDATKPDSNSRTWRYNPRLMGLMTDEERLLFYLSISETTAAGCLEWAGPRFTQKLRYGSAHWGGKLIVASRAVWLHSNGPIPAGLFVCHRCDNPCCVRLEHLFLGTPAENNEDMRTKGRLVPPVHVKGSDSPVAVLNEAVVALMKREHRLHGMGGTALARKYGFNRTTINSMLRGDSWQHVKEQEDEQS